MKDGLVAYWDDVQKAKVAQIKGHEKPRQSFTIAWRKLSYWWSTALTIFACIVVVFGICKEWNNPPWAENRHPALELFLFLFMLSWIALLEGCEISFIGLQAVNVEPYRLTHPSA